MTHTTTPDRVFNVQHRVYAHRCMIVAMWWTIRGRLKWFSTETIVAAPTCDIRNVFYPQFWRLIQTVVSLRKLQTLGAITALSKRFAVPLHAALRDVVAGHHQSLLDGCSVEFGCLLVAGRRRMLPQEHLGQRLLLVVRVTERPRRGVVPTVPPTVVVAVARDRRGRPFVGHRRQRPFQRSSAQSAGGRRQRGRRRRRSHRRPGRDPAERRGSWIARELCHASVLLRLERDRRICEKCSCMFLLFLFFFFPTNYLGSKTIGLYLSRSFTYSTHSLIHPAIDLSK